MVLQSLRGRESVNLPLVYYFEVDVHILAYILIYEFL